MKIFNFKDYPKFLGEIEKKMGVKVILMDAPAFKVGDVTMEMASGSLGKVYLMDLMNLARSSSVDEAMCKIVGEMVGNMFREHNYTTMYASSVWCFGNFDAVDIDHLDSFGCITEEESLKLVFFVKLRCALL